MLAVLFLVEKTREKGRRTKTHYRCRRQWRDTTIDVYWCCWSQDPPSQWSWYHSRRHRGRGLGWLSLMLAQHFIYSIPESWPYCCFAHFELPKSARRETVQSSQVSSIGCRHYGIGIQSHQFHPPCRLNNVTVNLNSVDCSSRQLKSRYYTGAEIKGWVSSIVQEADYSTIQGSSRLEGSLTIVSFSKGRGDGKLDLRRAWTAPKRESIAKTFILVIGK